MEIERKWLFDINKVPTGQSLTITHYRQAYISIEPEVRIRSKEVESAINHSYTKTEYALCIKGNGSLSRHEIQKDLTECEFEELKEVGNITDNMFINKRYYTISIEDDLELTVGVVDEGTKTEFCYGEIEFKTEEEAKNFIPEKWFGKEVTNDISYKMKNYWKRTRKVTVKP